MVTDPKDKHLLDNNKLQKEVYELIRTEFQDTEKKESITEIATNLIEILEQTELPTFEVPYVTTTSNQVVDVKMKYMLQVLTNGDPFPSWLMNYYDKASLLVDWKISPLTNNIHVTTRVLDYMNVIAALQRGDLPLPSEHIVLLGKCLYGLTIESDGNPELRKAEDIEEMGSYMETQWRVAGTTVNAQRHVSMDEMRFILWKIRMQFNKDESKRNQLF